MSKQVVALFVGGPWDGKTVVLREPRDYFEVAILPPLPVYVACEEPVSATEATHQRFVYRSEWTPGEQIVFVPQDWSDDPRHRPGEKLMNALLRGYVGRL